MPLGATSMTATNTCEYRCRTILNEYCALLDLVDREAVSALAQVRGSYIFTAPLPKGHECTCHKCNLLDADTTCISGIKQHGCRVGAFC